MDFNSPEDAKEYFDGVKGVVLPKRERAGRGVRV
jgi:hypothetical protein